LVTKLAAVWDVISSFRDEVGDVAEVEERQLTDRLRSIRFRPTNPEAAGVWLAVGESEVIVEVGKGGRFELGTGEADRRLLGELLRAAAVGRVVERSRRFSILTRVWLSDGTLRQTSVRAVADLGRRPSERQYGGKRATSEYAPWRPWPMQEPILSFEGYDLMVFASVTRAELFVEPYDVAVGDTYDAEGQVLRFEAVGRRTFLRETGEYHPDRLRAAIVGTFDAAGVAVAPDASLDELVRAATQRFSVG
jgi:hypothetical protein